MSRSLMGVIFCGKKSNALTLGFVLYLENVTVSNSGVFPGRPGGDYVRDRVDLSVSLGFFLCIFKEQRLPQLTKYLNIDIKSTFPLLLHRKKGGKAQSKGSG